MIEIFFARQAGTLDVLVENADGGIVLIVAEAGFHLGAQRAYEPDVIVGAAPGRQVFRIDIARFLEGIRRAARDMVNRFLNILFRAGLVAPFLAPAVGAAAAEADNPDDFGLLGKSRQMRGHRAARRVAEGDNFSAGEILVSQKTRTLQV